MRPATEKLQKVLARLGLGSRRQLEVWIQDGKVKINNKVAKLGDRVSEKDRLIVDDKPISQLHLEPVKTRVIAYHKPEGEVCTRSDPEGRKTIFEDLPRIRPGRWISIGRLDLNTRGLILLTNDGDLAYRLMHPSFEIEREYAVRILGKVDQDLLDRLKSGVELDDGMAKFEVIQDSGGEGANHWYHVIVKQGRCRLVRRLWESQGVKVSRLMRVRYGTIHMSRKLRPSKFAELDVAAIRSLKDLL